MTASRRYLPASIACMLVLGAGNAGLAAGGSALDPYANIVAPTSAKGSKKEDKAKQKHNIPLIKKALVEEKSVQEDPNQSQTYVKMPGSAKSKKQKDVVFNPEPRETKPVKEPKAKKALAEPVKTTTKVSDVAPVAAKEKPVVSGQNDETVIGGIKAIGAGYSKTFKAATHGVMHSTKAASEVVVSGSKKMTDGIKNGAKASGDAFKKSADVIGHGFKATGDKIKDGAAPLTSKIASKPDKPAKEEKKKDKAKEESKEKIAAKPKKETPVTDEPQKEGLAAKLTHMPKIPKLSIPFMGGKNKKVPVVDTNAGANEQGAAPVAVAPKQAPVQAAPKETPIGEEIPLETAHAPKPKKEKAEKIKAEGQGGIASIPGNTAKKLGKLWPFGHKDGGKDAKDVAGKQTQPNL